MQQLPGEIIHVRVTTKSASNLVKRELKEDGSLLYKVYVTVVPEGGKANEAVIKVLSKEFGIAKSRFEIVRGHTVRDKTIRITL